MTTRIIKGKSYQHLRLNFAMFLLDYLVFGVSFSLIGATSTVVPSFVSQMTDNKILIGFTGSIYLICWLGPQMFLAQIVNRGTRRKPFIRPIILFRMTIIIAATLIGIMGGQNRGLTLFIFLAAYGLFAAGDSLITLAWGDMLGTCIPDYLRGTMFGIGQFATAVGAIFTSALARWALSEAGPEFPLNYALLFGVSGVLFLIGGVGLSLLREEKSDETLEPGPPMREYFPYLWKIVRYDRYFQRFIGARLLMDLAMMATPFYAVLGISVLGIPREMMVSDSIILIQIGTVCASFLMAWLSRRSGSRAVIILAGLCVTGELSFALASALTGKGMLLYGTFIMTGAFHAVLFPSYFDWVITYAPLSRRPIYLGLTNTLGALGNLGPFIGGTILQWTASPAISGADRFLLGGEDVMRFQYPLVFGLALFFGLMGLLAILRLPEPRRREETLEIALPKPTQS